jgi:phospholipase/carboxylesterase
MHRDAATPQGFSFSGTPKKREPNHPKTSHLMLYHATTDLVMPDLATLKARPGRVADAAPSGQHPLPLGSRRNSYFYVPPAYNPSKPAPMVLLLHGAGGHAYHGLGLLQHLADKSGMILVAPASTGSTWDVIVNRKYGVDVELLDRALEHVFGRYAVDVTHLAIGGFSDDASYGLSLGVINGDLFTHVIAFSPGFMAPVSPRGQPAIFISHGTKDDVLPIDPCSRRIVPRLRREGYDVTYQEFDGPHTIPANIAESAVEWFVGTGRKGAGN